MNPFGVESHDVSKAAHRGRRRAARHATRAAKAPTATTSAIKTAMVGSAAATATGAALRYGAPAAVGAVGGAWAVRRQPKKRLRPMQTIDGVSKAQAMAGGKPITEDRLRQRKKVQGGLGMTAAGLGTTAFALKNAQWALPKLIKAPAKSAKYKKHIDDAADKVLYGAAGVGGASGLHQSRIYQMEGKVERKGGKLVSKREYDPEKRRMKRLKAYEGAGYAGAAAGAAAAARPNLKVSRQSKETARRQAVRGARMINQGAAELSYVNNHKGAARTKAAEAAAHKILRGTGQAASAANRKLAIRAASVPGKQRAVLAGAAAASGGGAVAVRRHRQGEGKPYQGWWDRSRVRKRLPEEPDWVSKAMPDQADLHVHGATANTRKKRPRPITPRQAKVSYC